MDSTLPDKTPNIDPTKSVESIGDDGAARSEVGTPTTSFSQYMQTPAQAPQAVQPSASSPLDLTRSQTMQMPQPTMDSLQGQMSSTSNSLSTLQSQLNTKNLKLKQSQNYLLRNKLSDANAQIRTAAAKAGVDVGSPPAFTTKQNPIKRYLSYISDSQEQIAAAQAKIKEISSNGAALSPGEMLLIQVKLNKAQQALDYSSVLLGKAVDDIKMLFNVQI